MDPVNPRVALQGSANNSKEKATHKTHSNLCQISKGASLFNWKIYRDKHTKLDWKTVWPVSRLPLLLFADY